MAPKFSIRRRIAKSMARRTPEQLRRLRRWFRVFFPLRSSDTLLADASHGDGHPLAKGRQYDRGARGSAGQRRSLSRRFAIEPLEQRQLLSVGLVSQGWKLVSGGTGTLHNGDSVYVMEGSTRVTGTLGTNAFLTVGSALAAAADGGEIDVLSGNYYNATPVERQAFRISRSKITWVARQPVGGLRPVHGRRHRCDHIRAHAGREYVRSHHSRHRGRKWRRFLCDYGQQVPVRCHWHPDRRVRHNQ